MFWSKWFTDILKTCACFRHSWCLCVRFFIFWNFKRNIFLCHLHMKTGTEFLCLLVGVRYRMPFFPFYSCVRKFSEMVPSFPCFYPNSRWVESKCNQMTCFIVTSLVPTHLYYIYGIMYHLCCVINIRGMDFWKNASHRSEGKISLTCLSLWSATNWISVFLLNEFIRNLNIVALYSRYFAFLGVQTLHVPWKWRSRKWIICIRW